jgi:kynureninase
MERHFEREDGIRGFQISTPPVIGLRAAKVGFEMIKEAGIKAINEKCLKGTDLMIELFDLWLEPLGFSLATPRERHRRCGHIIITHPDGAKIARALREVKNVYPDYREPNGIRFSFSPLPTSFIELYEGFARLRDLVASGDYKNLEVKEVKVT